MTPLPIRHSRRFLSYLDGSGPFQGQPYSSADETIEAAARRWVAAVAAAAQRSDGSRTPTLSLDEARVCYDYATSLVDAASDELSEPDNLADYNAGRAVVRRLVEAFGPAVEVAG